MGKNWNFKIIHCKKNCKSVCTHKCNNDNDLLQGLLMSFRKRTQTALVEKLLPGKPQENRKEVDVEKMRKAYMSSKDLLEVTSLSLQDAADILQVLYSGT